MPTPRVAALALLLAASCSKGNDNPAGTNPKAEDRGALVARVGTVEIREADLKRAMDRDPGASPGRFQTPESQKDLVDGLVRFELLAQAADRAGYTKDPDAVHALQQIAVTKLVNETLGDVAAPESITQEDVKREYDARQATDFTLPAAVRVRHIRVADSKLAERLAAQARALAPTDDAGFAALAANSSEDTETRAAGGDLGFVDSNSRLPPALSTASLALTTPGEIVGPLATPAGYEILRLVTLRAPIVSPFSSVEEPIRQRLYRERRARALEDFIDRLRRDTPVEVTLPKAVAAGKAVTHPD